MSTKSLIAVLVALLIWGGRSVAVQGEGETQSPDKISKSSNDALAASERLAGNFWWLLDMPETQPMSPGFRKLREKLKNGKVPTEKAARSIGYHLPIEPHASAALDRPCVVGLILSAANNSRFAPAGDFIWIVRITGGEATVQEAWINARTGEAKLIFPMESSQPMSK